MSRQICRLGHKNRFERCSAKIDGPPPPTFAIRRHAPEFQFELPVFLPPSSLEQNMRKATQLTVNNQPVTELLHAELHRNLVGVPRINISRLMPSLVYDGTISMKPRLTHDRVNVGHEGVANGYVLPQECKGRLLLTNLALMQNGRVVSKIFEF